MSETKLRECPFCGGEAYCEGYFGYAPQTIGFGETGHFVGCKDCGVVLKPNISKVRAINAWNTRITDEKYEKLLAYVQKLNEVEDCEYPFSLDERDDIVRPSELLKDMAVQQ